MSQNAVVETLIKESAELAEASLVLEKDAALVPGLQKDLEESNKKTAALVKADEDFKAEVRERAGKCADLLIERGMRVPREDFIERLAANPIEAFAVLEKVAAEISVPQIGAGDDIAKTAENMDPIERWCLGM